MQSGGHDEAAGEQPDNDIGDGGALGVVLGMHDAEEAKDYDGHTKQQQRDLVRTEAVLEAAKAGWLDLSNSESPEFVGRVVAALWADPRLMERSGKVLVAAALARELGVVDIDGRQPVPLTLERV